MGDSILHLFSMSLLFQRADTYEQFLAGYRRSTGSKFTLASWDAREFSVASYTQTALGSAFAQYRMRFWDAYMEQHGAYLLNQRGLFAHLVDRLRRGDAVAAFLRLKRQGGGKEATLHWLASLGVPVAWRMFGWSMISL